MNVCDVFKGLADPTRLRIVALLARQELCVCEIMEILGLPQSTVSRHVARLKNAGIVRDRRQGKWVHYSLESSPAIDDLKSFFLRHLAKIDQFKNDLASLRKLVQAKRCEVGR